MPDPREPAVRAAGGVVWRRVQGEVQVVLVHRPKYDDWSLPKGKLEPGEPAVVGAVREVAEETGFDAVPGRTLGESRYRVLSRGRDVPKTVRWWAMRCGPGTFVPGSEVDALRWLSVRAALAAVGSGFDTAPLEAFAGSQEPETATVLLSEAAAPDLRVLRAYGACRVVAGDPEVAHGAAQLAAALGVGLDRDDRTPPAGLAGDPPPVVCLPPGSLARALDPLAVGPPAPDSLWALSFRDGRLVDAVDTGRQD